MPLPISARKPSMSKASAAFELKTLPRIQSPTSARVPTAKRYTMALSHFRSKTWPRPGTSQPATAATSASAGLIGFVFVSAILGEQREDALLDGPRDTRFLSVYVDIHFAADAELFQVDSRFDGEAGMRQNRAQVVGLETIHIGAVTVHFLTDTVASAMDEIFAVARF